MFVRGGCGNSRSAFVLMALAVLFVASTLYAFYFEPTFELLGYRIIFKQVTRPALGISLEAPP